MKLSKDSGVSRLRGNRSISLFIVLMLIGFIGAGVNAYFVLRDASFDQRYLELAGDLRLYTQQIETSSREAAAGDAEAFEALAEAHSRFEAAQTVLERGSNDLPSPRELLSGELAAVDSVWERVGEAVQTIVTNKERIIFLHEVALTLNESIPVLQQEYNNVVEILLDRNAPADQVAVAQRQSWLAERIARNVDRMLEGGQDAPIAADQFNIDASTFGTVLRGMIEGNPAMQVSQVRDPEAQQSLQEISQLFEFVASSVDDIFQASPSLLEATTAAESIIVDAPKVQEATNQLSTAIDNLEDKLEALREQYAAEGVLEERRAKEEAEEARARMIADAEFRVSQEGKTARDNLSREALEEALHAAEALLGKAVTQADHDRIAEEYLDQIGPALAADAGPI